MKTEKSNIASNSPRVYVGTYHKYANGSIFGAWLDLDDYADADEFLTACRELHKDEKDPEFMLQDYENLPEELYNECASVEQIARMVEYAALDDYDKDILDAWLEIRSAEGDISDMLEAAQDAFFCKVDDTSWRAVAEYCADEKLIEIPEHLWNYFDFDAYGRDLSMEMTMSADGYVFRDC